MTQPVGCTCFYTTIRGWYQLARRDPSCAIHLYLASAAARDTYRAERIAAEKAEEDGTR